jgi:hypothetical protein
MIMVVAVALCAVTVPLFGGRLGRLAALQLRLPGLLVSALAIQVLLISVFPDRFHAAHVPAHLASYVLAGAFFVANRRVAGLWAVGLGGLGNFAAIAANGGVMPASPAAVAAASEPTAAAGGFINSAAVPDARLAWLGDVFAIPSSWPMSNVFSIGDVVIVLGIAVVLHCYGQSRLAPALRRAALARRLADEGSPA